MRCAQPLCLTDLKEKNMLRNILFAVGIGYLFRRFSGGRARRGYTTRW